MEDVVVTKSLRELCDDYNAANAAVAAAQAAVETAIQARSDACQAIAMNIAPENNVTFNGKPHTIVLRVDKDTKAKLYFLRAPKGKTIVVE